MISRLQLTSTCIWVLGNRSVRPLASSLPKKLYAQGLFFQFACALSSVLKRVRERGGMSASFASTGSGALYLEIVALNDRSVGPRFMQCHMERVICSNR